MIGQLWTSLGMWIFPLLALHSYLHMVGTAVFGWPNGSLIKRDRRLIPLHCLRSLHILIIGVGVLGKPSDL